MKKLIFLSLTSVLLLASCSKVDDKYLYDDTIAIDWNAAADSSSMTLAVDYWNTTGHFFNDDAHGNPTTNDYWPEAHGLDVLVDAYLRTNDDFYKNRIYDWYDGVKAKNWYHGGGTWENEYYDDMGWHGLAHMRAFEATGDTRYEQSAKELWAWITQGWSDYEGGGIKWRIPSDALGESKGIPANGPAAIIAARRWIKYGDTESYLVPGKTVSLNNLEWAKMIYEWIKENRFVPSTGRVFEDINNKNNDFLYNFGTFMGAALELYHITGDGVYLNDAIKMADYAIANRSANGILNDWGQQENHDVNLFKGIFVRYFTQLVMEDDLPDFARLRYVTFMKNNGKTLWENGTLKPDGGSVFYGSNWEEKPLTYDVKLRGELSGCMMMEAIALLYNEGYIKD
ncbi:glycoside hydrolase family 76 protein [Dysgonomonas sp. 25]|uniref:glycoside hydrolase family 76 protein n=1 Tax=Dysgonomonas sp. 25 TaxID=2302933 RepID=UPI0013D50D2F|nr:glycoside hydrolase family 76 protein [Dysgonomonas sp. 25]NDV69385.1 alpha-1,6-mannanase [Dysgonomonas sp. 25]